MSHLCALARAPPCYKEGVCGPCAWVPLPFSRSPRSLSPSDLTGARALTLVSMLSPSSTCPLPPSRVHYLTRYFDNLQIIEDSSKEGCKNGYLRHTDSSILDHGGAHRPGRPGDPSPEEGELVNLLAPFFNEKAALLLGAR